MRPLTVLGVLLILAGLAALAIGGFSFETEEKVLDLGPIEATAEEEHEVAIPPLAGIAAVVAGGFLVFIGRRRR